jgi:hypothetical protein
MLFRVEPDTEPERHGDLSLNHPSSFFLYSGGTMKACLAIALFLALLMSHLSASAQFMQGLGEGFQRTSQYNLARQQQATERERLKLQYADQWRQL